MTMHPEIAKYQSAPEYAYLNKEVITLPGKPPHVPQRTILLMESCGLVELRQGNIQGALRLREKDQVSLALEKMYAPMAGCSFGDVPTIDEFLALPKSDINEWLKVARRICPDNFEWLDKAEVIVNKAMSEGEVKKKGKKRRRSASG